MTDDKIKQDPVYKQAMRILAKEHAKQYLKAKKNEAQERPQKYVNAKAYIHDLLSKHD